MKRHVTELLKRVARLLKLPIVSIYLDSSIKYFKIPRKQNNKNVNYCFPFSCEPVVKSLARHTVNIL